MNKKEFLHTLELELKDFSENEKKEILYDYEEHFRIGEENEKSEEELIKELGNPRDIADQYRTASQRKVYTMPQKEDRNIVIAIIVALGLVFFNLVFILGPILGLMGGLVGGFTGAGGLIMAGVFMIICLLIQPLFNEFVHLPYEISHIALFFISIGTIALGTLIFIGMCYVVKFGCKAMAKYVSWNVKIIKG
jgi:uncharacterized membrane protein